MKIRSRLPALHLAVYASYFVAAIIVTWPLLTVFSTRLIGHPFGDSYEYIGLIWWLKHALQTGAPLFFNHLIAYPDGLSAALLWSIPLQSFPSVLFAFVMPLPAAFNLSILLTLALNGWAAFYLVSYLTSSRAASWMAGLIFMAYPTFQGQLAAGHIGLLQQWAVPLYVYALFRLRQTGERRWMLLGALFFVLSLLGSSVILIYELFPITAVFFLALLFRREWANLRRLLLTVLIGGLFSLVFLVPALLDTLSTPARLNERGDIIFSADLLAIVSPPFQNPVFSALDYPHRVLGVDPFEKMAYIGIAAGLLALVALWRKPGSRWWLLLGFVAWVLSLGPVLKILDSPLHLSIEGYDTLVALPWLAAQNIPFLNISRTPARFDFTVALVVAVLAGWGLNAVLDAIASRRTRFTRPLTVLTVIIVLVFVLFEYPFFWKDGLPDMPTIPGIVPAPIASLSGQGDLRAVFDIPWDHLITDKEAMFLQTGHQLPLIAGHIARRTPVDPAKLTLLQQTLDPALLNAAGVDIIILHKQWDDAEGKTGSFARSRLGAPFYEDENYAVFNAPHSDDSPAFTSLLSSQDTITDHADSYLYTPSPGWTVLKENLASDERDVSLWLNGTRINGWHTAGGQIPIEVPVFLPTSGYYTLTISLDPPCPTSDDVSLTCRSVQVSGASLADFLPTGAASPIEFAHGLSLMASRIDAQENRLSVWLDWHFADARTENDIRFIHVVDAQGNLVAQNDNSLGVQPTGSAWSESVPLALNADLPSGDYHVYVGWYAYPDTTPFSILSNTPDANSGLLQIGTFTRP